MQGEIEINYKELESIITEYLNNNNSNCSNISAKYIYQKLQDENGWDYANFYFDIKEEKEIEYLGKKYLKEKKYSYDWNQIKLILNQFFKKYNIEVIGYSVSDYKIKFYIDRLKKKFTRKLFVKKKLY